MRVVTVVSVLALCALSASCGPKAADASAHHGDKHDAGHEGGHDDTHASGQGAAHGGEHGAAHGGAHNAHAAAPMHMAANTHGAGHASGHGAPHAGGAWAYDNQSVWGSLAPENAQCTIGQAQSPIHLSSGQPAAELPDLNQRYISGDGVWTNDRNSLHFKPATHGSMLMIGMDAYELTHFQFRSPSEHLMDKRAFPLELQFVHKNTHGHLAVVGVFIEEGPSNPALEVLVGAMPHGTGEAMASQVALDPVTLLPADRTYYAYAGSLTTPPCSEGVRWNVMRQPLTASAEQIAALREKLGASSRHPQPLNGRTLLMGL